NAPEWNVDTIKVRSFAYIGTEGLDQPNNGYYEYTADFGGGTVTASPVTVAFTTQHSELATLMPDGDLLLNMGPRAGARLDGNTTDGAESFTIKYLSSNDD